MMGSTRLWLAGTVQVSRDQGLATGVFQHVRRAAKTLRPLLVVTDGWSASPGRIRRALREQVNTPTGRGRACVQVCSARHMGTIITRTQNKRVVEITRTMAHGVLEHAERVRALFRGGKPLHPAGIERVNGPFRERVASLTRKRRHAAARLRSVHTGMDLIGWTSTVCLPHQERSQDTHGGRACPPAMASGLPDPVWSVGEVLSDNVAPPPWGEPTRRGRPPQPTEPQPTETTGRLSVSRPVLRLRKGVVCSTTSSCGSVRRVTRFVYPQRRWEACGGIFLDHHASLKPKGRGDRSMREKHWCSEDGEEQVMHDPHRMVKAGWLEAEFPVGAPLLPSRQHLARDGFLSRGW